MHNGVFYYTKLLNRGYTACINVTFTQRALDYLRSNHQAIIIGSHVWDQEVLLGHVPFIVMIFHLLKSNHIQGVKMFTSEKNMTLFFGRSTILVKNPRGGTIEKIKQNIKNGSVQKLMIFPHHLVAGLQQLNTGCWVLASELQLPVYTMNFDITKGLIDIYQLRAIIEPGTMISAGELCREWSSSSITYTAPTMKDCLTSDRMRPIKFDCVFNETSYYVWCRTKIIVFTVLSILSILLAIVYTFYLIRCLYRRAVPRAWKLALSVILCLFLLDHFLCEKYQ